MGGVVVMAAPPISPVIPKTVVPRGDTAATTTRARRPLPIPALSTPPDAVPVVYALSAVNRSGRVADRSIVRALTRHPAPGSTSANKAA